MSKTYIMSDSGKSYTVTNAMQLVEQVKNSNAHSASLATEEYIAKQCAVMKNLWGAKNIVSPSAESLVNSWLECRIIALKE